MAQINSLFIISSIMICISCSEGKWEMPMECSNRSVYQDTLYYMGLDDMLHFPFGHFYDYSDFKKYAHHLNDVDMLDAEVPEIGTKQFVEFRCRNSIVVMEQFPELSEWPMALVVEHCVIRSKDIRMAHQVRIGMSQEKFLEVLGLPQEGRSYSSIEFESGFDGMYGVFSFTGNKSTEVKIMRTDIFGRKFYNQAGYNRYFKD